MNWTAILFFVAAALAVAAFLIDFSNNRLNWTVAAGALFLAGLGVARWRKPGPRQPGAGR
jgi:hypothetical protein